MINIQTILLLLLLAVVQAFPGRGQTQTTHSPYSRFGIGDIRPQGYAFTRAMGGIAQGVRNGLQVNYLNPASYSAQDTLSFIFDFAVEGSGVRYQQGELTNLQNTGNIHHLAFQFPVAKWWGVGAGIQPFTEVGYNLRYIQTDDRLTSSIGPIRHHHLGKGGISQVYFGNAFEPFRNLSLGVNISYLFGSLEQHRNVYFPTNRGYTNTYTSTSLVVRDFAFSLGAQYHLITGSENQFRLVAGATVDMATPISAGIITLTRYPSGQFLDTLAFTNEDISPFTIPANYSGGFTFSYKNVVTVGADFAYQDWSGVSLMNPADSMTNSQSLRFGLEITPDQGHHTSYWRRISYRAGLRQTNSHIVLNGNRINDMAVSFGLGLPLRRTGSSFNLSFELGQRGTLSNNLIRETYGIVNFGVTFHDIWFYRPKIR